MPPGDRQNTFIPRISCESYFILTIGVQNFLAWPGKNIFNLKARNYLFHPGNDISFKLQPVLAILGLYFEEF